MITISRREKGSNAERTEESMKETYFKEEITYSERLPAKIIHQTLSGSECFTPMHWHNEIEVNLMLRGMAEFTVNG